MSMTRLVFTLCAALLVSCATTAASQLEKRDVSSLVVLEADSIRVGETIRFAHGRAEIEPTSMDLLDAVARILLETDSITLLSIVGHTDSTGEPAANQPLSEARALAVKKYLEGKGVAAARLSSTGYGSSRPLESNDAEAGRARNRRVEFKVTR